jgi:hypothetical protein
MDHEESLAVEDRASPAPALKRKAERFAEEPKIERELDEKPTAKPQKREQKQIYTAEISLEVRNIKETQKTIISLIEETKGFLQTQTDSKISLRVPRARFDEMVEKIVKLGVVVDKKIYTYDVTDRYAEIEKRLDIALEARKRLQTLLSQVKKVKERVRIVEEIRRLTRVIEYYRQMRQTLDSFVNYSLIEIFLKVPESSSYLNISRKNNQDGGGVSPFPWINTLTPDRYTLDEVGSGEVKIPLTENFILFDKQDHFLARSPGGSFIRAGKAVNEPRGDKNFWQKALDTGMKLKNYVKEKEGEAGDFVYSFYRYQTLNPYYYLVALNVREGEILVTEAYFSNEVEMKKYLQDTVEKMKSIRFQ